MLSNGIAYESTPSAARDVLLCFSHLRWNFVFQRPQQLLSRAARTYRVFFFEEPRFEAHAAPSLERRLSDEGVTVLVPVLPTGMRPTEVTRVALVGAGQGAAIAAHAEQSNRKWRAIVPETRAAR